MGDGAWTARRLFAGAASILVVISYVVCIVIAKEEDTYVGGLDWPFFSDIGRDDPAYYVFVSMNCTASVLMFGFMILQYRYISAWCRAIGCITAWRCRAAAALACGFLAPVGSILLSIFPTNTHAALHAYSAYAFFGLFVLYSGFTYFLMWSIARERPDQHWCLLVARSVVVVLLVAAVVMYIPVGTVLGCEDRLTMEKCLTLESASFCQDNERDANTTNLWDYSRCEDWNMARSLSQFASIVMLMIFVALHVLDPNPQEDEDTSEDQQQEAAGGLSHDPAEDPEAQPAATVCQSQRRSDQRHGGYMQSPPDNHEPDFYPHDVMV